MSTRAEEFASDVAMARSGYFSKSLVFTALCIWENWEAHAAPEIEALRDWNGGVYWLRDAVVPDLAIIIDGIWNGLTGECQDNWGAFDFEFVPAMMGALKPLRSHDNQGLNLEGWTIDAARTFAESKTSWL